MRRKKPGNFCIQFFFYSVLNAMPSFISREIKDLKRVKDNWIYDRNRDGPFPSTSFPPYQEFLEKKCYRNASEKDSKKTGNMRLQSSDTSVRERRNLGRKDEWMSASEMASDRCLSLQIRNILGTKIMHNLRLNIYFERSFFYLLSKQFSVSCIMRIEKFFFKVNGIIASNQNEAKKCRPEVDSSRHNHLMLCTFNIIADVNLFLGGKFHSLNGSTHAVCRKMFKEKHLTTYATIHHPSTLSSMTSWVLREIWDSHPMIHKVNLFRGSSHDTVWRHQWHFHASTHSTIATLQSLCKLNFVHESPHGTNHGVLLLRSFPLTPSPARQLSGTLLSLKNKYELQAHNGCKLDPNYCCDDGKLY